NFLIRKRVLEYDDVMNEQRRVVYKYRGEILEGRDMSDIARDELSGVIGRLVEEYTPGDLIEDWDLPELDTQLHLIWPCAIDVEGMAPESVDREGLKAKLVEDAQKAYDERESELGDEVMRYLERTLLMQVIDSRWREHLYDMDYLREGIHLRGFAQIDPLVAYKNEGYSMFSELMNAIWEEFSKLVFNVEIEIEPEQAGAFAAPVDEPQNFDYAGGTSESQPSALTETAMEDEAPRGPNPVGFQAGSSTILTGGATATKVKSDKENIGRNDPCWCGSGKKFKKCHGS
ncbi:MAG: SEC-C metal-binding domain-containing protein, partial [Solirubrobacterales bacterium]